LGTVVEILLQPVSAILNYHHGLMRRRTLIHRDFTSDTMQILASFRAAGLAAARRKQQIFFGSNLNIIHAQ
jgi:hypothetical protein